MTSAFLLSSCSEEFIDALNTPSRPSSNGYSRNYSSPLESSSKLGSFPAFNSLSTQ